MSIKDLVGKYGLTEEDAREIAGVQDLDAAPLQQVAKYCVIGGTNTFEAHQGSVRSVIGKEMKEGALKHVKREGSGMGVPDGSIGMGCNAVHIPDAREGELTREIGLMTRHDLESFLDYLEAAQQTRGSPVKPETISLGLKPIAGQELSSIYKPSDTPLELRSRQQIIVQLKEKTEELAKAIDISTPYGKIQHYILLKSLNSLIKSINAKDEFYQLLYGFTRLLPYIVEQIPQDDGVRNIFVARDAGVYNIVRGLQKKHGVRE